jgi:hypothetical protein
MTAGSVSAAGSLSEGNAAAATGEYNARIAENEAVDALSRGSNEEARYRRDIAQLAGAQNAFFGAGNVTRSGTALDLISDTAYLGEQDALTIRENARRAAEGKRSEAQGLRMQGRLAKRNSRFRAGASLLTSGAQAYGYHRTT